MKKLFITSVLFFSFLLLAACGSNDNAGGSDDGDADNDQSKLEQLKEDGVIKVGYADEKPYGYEDDDGNLTGASVETAKAVFKELGIDEVEGQLSDYDNLVPGVQAGKFDAITSGLAIEEDRCENAAFGEPDMEYGEGLVVQKGNPLDLHSYDDIADDSDVSVAIMSGATEIGFVDSAGVDDSQIDELSDIPDTIDAVATERADATTATEMTAKMAAMDNDNVEFVEDFEQPDVEGVPSYGAVAFNPDDEELLDAYNDKLEELKEDGTIEEILEDNYFDAENNFPDDDISAEMVCEGEDE